MIKTFDDIDIIAAEKGPKKLAVLAPEDEEFMLAIKTCRESGLIEPVLVGNRDTMERVAASVEFDITHAEKIYEEDRQVIADISTAMLFAGDIDMESKGQIPTSYVYRSIIKEESKAGTGRTVSVISLWGVPGLNHFIALTDTGVNIKPDCRAKMEVIKNAVFLFNILGSERPRVAVLSGHRGVGGEPDSYHDAMLLNEAATSGELGQCEIIDATSFSDIFTGKNGRLDNYRDIDINSLPEILLVPDLDTGNILVKLDFFLDVTRRSLVITSRGPVIIPSRSDFSDSIIGELALGVVVAERMKGL